MPCGVGSFSNPPTINPDEKDLSEFDGKVVHLEGPLYEVRLEDHEFFFSRRGVKLDRVVEMYQWVRKTKKGGGVDYVREWRADLIDSSTHPQGKLNPRAMPFTNHTQMSLPVRLGYSGRLSLDKNLNDILPPPSFVPVEAEDLSKLQRPLQGTMKLAQGYFFRGRDIRMASVGDVRVSFRVLEGRHVTALLTLAQRVLKGCDGGEGRGGPAAGVIEEGSHTLAALRAMRRGVWRGVLAGGAGVMLLVSIAAWAVRLQSRGKKKE